MKSLAALLLLVLARSIPAASCVPAQIYANNSASRIKVTAGSGASASDISGAIALWENCSGYGSSFPSLSGSYGTISITVQRAGTSTAQGGGCGMFEPLTNANNQITGGTITHFTYMADGRSCADYVPYDQTIAHELGHVLGLDNLDTFECMGSIMAGPIEGGSRQPSADECQQAGEQWATPTEQQMEECELQCSVPCTPGNPPTCQDSGDGGGDDSGDPGCTFGACSPLVLDLNGDGIHTTSANTDPVLFDLDGDGVLDLVGWTDPSTEEALLYYDHNKNRVIDGGGELFGEVTVLPDGRRAQNGFDALAAYDHPDHGGNGDGVISPSDGVWGRIRLWVDRNHDGIMTNDENYSLGQAHIVALNLAYEQATGGESWGVDAAGNYHFYKGTFVQRVGKKESHITRALHDVYFKMSR